ncbi:MAG TPA: cytochrome c maturation protein CcmE [Thermoleophilaceae bacterium]|nr:cytochrome c maturation protein CcmE [Thermoleophilaceae bacterium]
MDPRRKRKLRLAVLLSVALMLAAALVYTSFSAATETRQPSEVLASAEKGRSYELTGKVVDGSVDRGDDMLRFRIRDRAGTESVPVEYTGAVPDPFREGREVIVTGELRDGVFVAERDSLVTKCPSKFTNADDS